MSTTIKQWEYGNALSDRDRIRRDLIRTISHLEILSSTLDDFRGYKEAHPQRKVRLRIDSGAVDAAGFKAATGHTALILTAVKAYKEHYESQEIASFEEEDFSNFNSVTALEENVRNFTKLCRDAILGPRTIGGDTELADVSEIKNKFSPEFLMKCVLDTVIELAPRKKFAGALQPEQLEQLKKALAEVAGFLESLASSILAEAQTICNRASRTISGGLSGPEEIERLKKVLAELKELNEISRTKQVWIDYISEEDAELEGTGDFTCTVIHC